ncbi:MAG: hypothetical protein J6Q82_07440 [Clostridia bacterium]|nr:hypothetical protein [Clostridia bacterium]
MKKKGIALLTAMLALVLELLPYGAVCNFANPEGEPWRRTYSYFDPTPFGYANFGPLLTALLTCVLLLLLLVSVLTKKPMKTPIRSVSVISTLLSLAPLLLGVSFFSIVGALISFALLCTSFVLFVDRFHR